MTTRSKAWWLVTSLLVASAVGCSTTRGAKSETPEVEVDEPFPKQKELDEIEPSGDPSKFYQERRTHVEKWALKKPLPTSLGLTAENPETPWESVLAEAVEETNGDTVASEGMHCAARQFGHFYLDKGAFPAGNLREYMATRCGALTRNVATIRWKFDKVPKAPETKIAERWKQKGKQRLAEVAAKGEHRSMGIWYGQNDERAILLVTTGKRAVDVETRPLRVEGEDGLVVEGEIHGKYRRMEALRTESTFGYDQCSMDRSVELPNFRVECARNGAAERTAVQLIAYRQQRGLGRILLSTAIWNDGSDDAVFEPTEAGRAVARAFDRVRSSSGTSSEAGGSASGETTASTESAGETGTEAGAGDQQGPTSLQNIRQFVDLVNLVREEAGLEPVAFESRQAEQVQRLAGRYFKTMYETRDHATARKIALGLMAGWRVDGDIVSGSFASRAVQSTRAEVLLERMVATPSGRQALLDPAIDRMAVGLTRPADREATGVLVTAYRDLPSVAHEKRASRAFETINEIRKQQGVSPVTRDTSLETKIEELVRQVESGQLEHGQAQRQLMSVAARSWNRQVAGAWALSNSLDEMNLPEPLTKEGITRLAVMVVPYNDPDAAWTSYMVMTVYPVPAEMASSEPAAPGEGRRRVCRR